MKTGKNKRKIYWDTSVLIAWLMDERCWPIDVLEGIEDVVYALEKEEIILMTSTMTRSEVFLGKLTEAQKEKYEALMHRKSLQEIVPDSRVTARSSLIREQYKSKPVRVEVRTPDAIHLATAILYGADELQCLDGTGGRGLLRFNGQKEVSGLNIITPYPLRRPPAEMVTIKGPLLGNSGGKDGEQQKALAKPPKVQGGGSGHTQGQA